MQIVKADNYDQVDLRIVDRTFTKLEIQAKNSKFSLVNSGKILISLWLTDTKILAIHVEVNEAESAKRVNFNEQIAKEFTRRMSLSSDPSKLEEPVDQKSVYSADLTEFDAKSEEESK